MYFVYSRYQAFEKHTLYSCEIPHTVCVTFVDMVVEKILLKR